MPDPHFADPQLARLYDAFDSQRSDLDHYVGLVEELGASRVLDIGCGTGVLALMMADRGMEVIGVDPAVASLDVARAEPGSERVTWVEADAAHLPVAEDVDVVVMTGNVAQMFLEDEEWAAVLRRAAAVLGTGGHLVFEVRDPARTQARGPFTPRFRSRAEIEQSLADAWLDLVEVRGPRGRPGHELVFIARKPFDERDHQDRGWRDLARIDADLESGRIDEAQWHERALALIEAAYLSATTPHAQSGKGGDAAGWEYARRLLCDAIHRDGTFLDIGCANGLLMADLQRWAAAEEHAIEPHGVEISAKLADLARARCPQWADRIHTANANGWMPPRRYDFVRTGLDYVPAGSRPAYLQHLADHVVAPGGRLIIGVHNLPDDDELADDLARWGLPVDGVSRRPHAQPGLAYTIHWIDTPSESPPA
ncbi:methyltransferase domain-containing protein [Nocardioides dilutus]